MGVKVSNKDVLELLLIQQREVKDIKQWRQIEAIWLREKLSMSGPHVAEALGYRLQTVHLLWHRWLKLGITLFKDKKRPGGRNHAYMSKEEEQGFLRSFIKKAESGGILQVQEIKEAYEMQMCKKVAKSTIYRLLDRHGWRKIAPRGRHPKADPAKQDEIKKLIYGAGEKGESTQHKRKKKRPIKIMFMDEARFGRIADKRHCWAPSGIRPVVSSQIIREFTYAYVAVSPFEGQMEALILPEVNARSMSIFLREVSQNNVNDHIVMVMDRAG